MQHWFIVLLVLKCINTVSTYKCYSCSSVMYNGCGDPFDPDGLTTMKTSAGEVCAKYIEPLNNHTYITRTTMRVETCPSGENNCKSETKNGVTFTQCCCDTNLCNSATTFRQQSVVGYLIVAILATTSYRLF